MLLTISVDQPGKTNDPQPVTATDFGFVVHKHPDRMRTVSTNFGKSNVFWTKANPEKAEMALYVEVDSLSLVRRGRGEKALADYVNDRPYVASSFLSVAIGKLFRSAMAGSCDHRPELVDMVWPLTIKIPVVQLGKLGDLPEKLFSPLGYDVTTQRPLLDSEIPDWGEAPVGSITLKGSQRASDMFKHLYVLLPVLDNQKHYWIDSAEVEKLLRQGQGWLETHPDHELITRRYLQHRRSLTNEALERLFESDDTTENTSSTSETEEAPNLATEERVSLNVERMKAVTAAVLASASSRPSLKVVDLGCGEGRLLSSLANESSISELLGVDVSTRALQIAERRLKLEKRPERKKPTLKLRQSGLTYFDDELVGFDVACLVEVIEHIETSRLDFVEQNLFSNMKPKTVLVTTPNSEYNTVYEMTPGSLRHSDHRFEWDRQEFKAWCEKIREQHGYQYTITGIGDTHKKHGPPTQMATFELQEQLA